MQNGISQNLLIDADDTLWENNIYFERVISSVRELLEQSAMDPQTFRAHLDETERRHIPVYGYGTRNFARALVAAVETFTPGNADPALKSKVHALAMDIMHQPLEILDGVPETLEYLAERHSLFLVTKGNTEEQSQKIENSGLKEFFRAVEILPEKNASIYRRLTDLHGWDPMSTWMIGNSPRSDINPALTAGINAVYIPHPHTWVLEHEEPVKHPRMMELERFSDLKSHF